MVKVGKGRRNWSFYSLVLEILSFFSFFHRIYLKSKEFIEKAQTQLNAFQDVAYITLETSKKFEEVIAQVRTNFVTLYS